MLAPLPPVIGGMAELATLITKGLETDGYQVIKVNLGAGWRTGFTLPALYLTMLQAVISSDVVLVVSASGTSLWMKDLFALIFARLLAKKAVLIFVGGKAAEEAHRWGWWRKLPFAIANKVVVPTIIFRDALQKQGLPGQFDVIPHVVGVEEFLSPDPKTYKPILLAAKGLTDYAGVDLILQAFQIVQRRIPECQLVIAGDGPLRKDLESFVSNQRIAGVSFLGAIAHERMPSIMASASVFVHGTQFESFGIALVEAMAAGLPVVAFSIGGIPEVVTHGATGFLAEYGDIEIFAQYILRLLEDRALWEIQSLAAQEHSRRYSWQETSKLWQSVLTG